jgi:hypothetical protein
MKLIDLIRNIENIDDDAIIFQEDKEDLNSDIILSHAEEGDGGVKQDKGRLYFYLIEVFLVKEFIEDWIEGLGYRPKDEEIAKRLYEYAINDA